MSDARTDHLGTPEIVLVSPSITAVVWGEMAFSAIPAFQREARARVDAALAAQGVRATGPAVTVSLPPSGDRIRLAVGVTIAGGFRATDDVSVQQIPAGRAAHLHLRGPYSRLPDAWRMLASWIAENGHEATGPSWEAYGDPSVPVTDLYVRLASRGAPSAR